MSNSKNKTIVQNTTFLYIRMLVIMLVTLYTSRIVLQTLGVEDFGIYNIVGGIVAMLSFFTSSLSNVSQRYISIGLGKNNQLETEEAFKQSFTLMFIASVLLLIIGETIGIWLILNKLNIPDERMYAAIWVYQFSLVSIFFSINQVPLLGAIIANEHMNIYAVIGLFEAALRLGIIYIIQQYENCDLLILYGILMGIIPIIIWGFFIYYCHTHFKECKLHFFWDKILIKEMGIFIGNNLYGCFAWSAGIQGTNILLNVYFGPTVNAARAISIQVSSVITRFTENIMTAAKPQIIKLYATNNKEKMIILIEKSSKYSFFLSTILAIPAIIDTNSLLSLWLGIIPNYTKVFTQLIICEALIGVFIPPLWIAANATGKIKRSQVYGRTFTLLVLPISFIFLKIYPYPYIPFVLMIFANIGYWLYCLYDIHHQIGLNVKHYFIEVIKPAFILLIILSVVGVTTIQYINLISCCLLRIFILYFITLTVGCFIIYFILLDKNEKKGLKELINK